MDIRMVLVVRIVKIAWTVRAARMVMDVKIVG
jgi:hypothetical protein